MDCLCSHVEAVFICELRLNSSLFEILFDLLLTTLAPLKSEASVSSVNIKQMLQV